MTWSLWSLRLPVTLCALLATQAWPASFDAVVRSVETTRPTPATQELNGRIYGASVQATIQDADGNNANFDDGDRMSLSLTGRTGRSLSFNGDRAAFEQFVRDNADAIVKLLFPSGIGTAVNGIDDSQAIAINAFNTHVAPVLTPREQAFSQGLVDKLMPFQETGMAVNVERFRVDDVRGTSIKAYPNYSFSVGKSTVSVTMPLKYSLLDDRIGTNAYNFGLELDGSFPLVPGEKRGITLSVGTFGNALLFTSDAIGLGGFLRYGGIAGLSAKTVLRPFVLKGGFSYTASKLEIPHAATPSELEPLVRALKKRPVDQQLNYGMLIGVPFWVKYVVNLRVNQTETVGASALAEDKQSFTTVDIALGVYLSPKLAVNVGYAQVFGLKNLDSGTGLLLAGFNF